MENYLSIRSHQFYLIHFVSFFDVGNSALHYACAYGWYFCVKLLLDAGAQSDPSNDWKVGIALSSYTLFLSESND